MTVERDPDVTYRRPWTDDVVNADGATTVTTKRICNACDRAIGDGTPEEIAWAMEHGGWPDVREECPYCTPAPLLGLLDEAATWCQDASWGDGGEVPHFSLSWDGRRSRWVARARSFYDGGGEGTGRAPAAAVHAMLEAVRRHPEIQREAERQGAILALAGYLRCTSAEAERRLGEVVQTLPDGRSIEYRGITFVPAGDPA